jgi:hypothetical protein
MELISSFNDTIPVIAIDNKDKPLCVLEIMPPERSDLFSAKRNKAENSIKQGAIKNEKKDRKIMFMIKRGSVMKEVETIYKNSLGSTEN